MKETSMKKAALYLAIAVTAAACASKETKTEPPVVERSIPPAPTAGGGSIAQPRVPPQPVMGNPLTDPNSPLSKRSVYFDFDSNAVKDDYRGLVQAHSRYMTNDKRDARIRIEGNCDERGSREYNLALGQRRADAVQKRMAILGIPADRIESVSYGKEKPKATGHDETSWSENRRSDIVYR